MSWGKFSEFERVLWHRELDDFVPEKVFDAHVHIWSEKCCGQNIAETELRKNSDVADTYAFFRDVFPGRKVDFNLLSTPVMGMDFQRNTEFMAEEMAKTACHAASMGISPELSAEYIADAVEKHHFTGLKPYLIFAEKQYNAQLFDFLPESHVEVADHYSLNITLHFSKPDCCADKGNQRDLEYLTGRYPRVRWILAHCARSFNPVFLEESIDFWRGLPNIWYDLSAVTDVYSHWLLFKKEQISRLMFGSDSIVPACFRGNYVTWGRMWNFHFDDAPTSAMACYEQLRSQKRAADMAELSRGDIEKIFWDNAAVFFNFDKR